MFYDLAEAVLAFGLVIFGPMLVYAMAMAVAWAWRKTTNAIVRCLIRRIETTPVARSNYYFDWDRK